MNGVQSQRDRDVAKAVIAPLRAALYDFDIARVKSAIEAAFTPDAVVRLGYPFEDLDGALVLFDKALAPLKRAFPDLERRDTIVMAGRTNAGELWVGCLGYYAGKFAGPFLDIPPTGHFATMRFHEFYRIEDGRVAEFQSLWDIPELMFQAGVWPMAPQLGRAWYSPAPVSQDGLSIVNNDDSHAAASLNLITEMLEGLSKFATGGVEAMRLADYWHPQCSWYGPFGIGTCRGVEGFRNWHQIPFLNGMPDRQGTGGNRPFFADGDYVAVTGWPNMRATISNDGWMGIAPSGQKISMRSLDFWRCENGQIRENWVLVDLLSVYRQIGVDVFARMKEFNKARTISD